VALAPVGSANGTYAAWQYLNGLLTPPSEGLASATLSFPVPLAAGEYELRLFVNGGFQRLATSTKVVSASPAVQVSLVSPTEGATFDDPPITLEASASTNSGTIASVSFYADGELIASDTAAPFTTSWASPSPGSHVLTAVAVNTTSQSATSVPIHVTMSQIVVPHLDLARRTDERGHLRFAQHRRSGSHRHEHGREYGDLLRRHDRDRHCGASAVSRQLDRTGAWRVYVHRDRH
jgi:hypothetical protein